MPIYEYRCADCRRRTSVFVRSMSSPVTASCEHCGGRKLTRLMSRFAVRRGAVDIDDPSSMDDLDENDPQSVARWARRMSDEMGDDLGPEFDQMMGRIEAGESPEDVMGEEGMGGANGDGGLDGDDDF